MWDTLAIAEYLDELKPEAIMALPAMREWIEDAKSEPEEVEELDVEF